MIEKESKLRDELEKKYSLEERIGVVNSKINSVQNKNQMAEGLAFIGKWGLILEPVFFSIISFNIGYFTSTYITFPTAFVNSLPVSALCCGVIGLLMGTMFSIYKIKSIRYKKQLKQFEQLKLDYKKSLDKENELISEISKSIDRDSENDVLNENSLEIKTVAHEDLVKNDLTMGPSLTRKRDKKN